MLSLMMGYTPIKSLNTTLYSQTVKQSRMVPGINRMRLHRMDLIVHLHRLRRARLTIANLGMVMGEMIDGSDADPDPQAQSLGHALSPVATLTVVCHSMDKRRGRLRKMKSLPADAKEHLMK